ncbi:hypothetical protein OSSY52_20920 [Tepiditoga spiralis]|uniref:O-antigen ligase-related domain-containing protein n=1 Tax=Tepiditoga spiralis TaxID=2108365 RepID=A0A7G1G688_9BACT|nr:O-antigen ligase family protein [Tepiditoga spiralis]BBE31951.1 hypothetical protein OSSY52_20920 [Tepiditoga spiralis]
MSLKKDIKLPYDIGLILSFLIVLPFFIIPKWVYEFSTQKHMFFALFFTALFISYLFTKRNKVINIEYTPVHIFFSFFGISTLLSLISVAIENPIYLRVSVETSLYTILIISVSFLITKKFGEKFKYIEYALFALLITGTIIAIDGLLNKLFGFDIFFGKIGDPNARIALRTTIGNPNFVSDYLAQLLPIAVYFTLKKDSNLFIRFYGLFNIFIMYWVILFAQTRSVYMGLFAGMIVALVSVLISYKNQESKEYLKSKKFIYYFITIIIIFIFLFGMFNIKSPFNKSGEVNASSRFVAMANGSSWDERTLSWMAAIKQFQDKNHPQHIIIGGGIDTYPVYALYYMKDVQKENPERFLYAWNNFKRAHNDYLQVLGETGLIGFFSILGIIISLLFIFFKSIKQEKNFNKMLLFSLFAWIATITIVHSATEFPMHMHPNIMVTLFVLSVAVSKQFNTIKIKKINTLYVLIPIILIGIVVSYLKVLSTASEVYFKYGNNEYSKLDQYYEISNTKIPQVLNNINAQINTYKNQLKNYSPFSEQFKKINEAISSLESRKNTLKREQINYFNNAKNSYLKSKEYFLKSLDMNPAFGKSAFYLAQFFTKYPFRYEEVNYNSLPDIFELKRPEYRYIINEFKGSIDLMPFTSNKLRDTVKDIYNLAYNEETKNIILSIQTTLDEIDELEYAYTSFNEKNAYRLISKYHLVIIEKLNILKSKVKDSKKIDILLDNELKEFFHWYDEAIKLLPGAWNRFPEWENIYSEYIKLNMILLNSRIYNQSILYNKILEITKQDGMANYYMALKFRGIPDVSLELLDSLYLASSTEYKDKLINAIINNYKDVYNYYLDQKNKNSNLYINYKQRIDKFIVTYSHYLNKR